jgi:hypothetical protein
VEGFRSATLWITLLMPTPCAQGSKEKSISLARIALLCVIKRGFIRCLGSVWTQVGPKFQE